MLQYGHLVPPVGVIEIQLEAALGVMADVEIVYRRGQRQTQQPHHTLRRLAIANARRHGERLLPDYWCRRRPRAGKGRDSDHRVQYEIHKDEQAGAGMNPQDQFP